MPSRRPVARLTVDQAILRADRLVSEGDYAQAQIVVRDRMAECHARLRALRRSPDELGGVRLMRAVLLLSAARKRVASAKRHATSRRHRTAREPGHDG